MSSTKATKQHPLGSDEERLEHNLRPKSGQRADNEEHTMDSTIPSKAQEKTERGMHKPCNVSRSQTSRPCVEMAGMAIPFVALVSGWQGV